MWYRDKNKKVELNPQFLFFWVFIFYITKTISTSLFLIAAR